MLFRLSTAIVSTLLLAQGALAALTPDQVVTNIGIVTAVSGDINNSLQSLTTSTGPANVGTISQNAVRDFTTIVNDLAADVTAMQATPPFDDVDAGLVVDALSDFVRVHQILLSTVIGKQSIFAQFGLTAPIAAVLRSLEAGIDSFAFAMISLIPTRTGDVTGDKNSLDESVTNTITAYSQICIPSPLYPAVMPICLSL